MATMTKDKNYLVFTNNDNRTYKFDINTGVFYSSKGNALKNTPTGFATYIQRNTHTNSVINFLYNKHSRGIAYNRMGQYAELLTICDKLDSIGYCLSYWQMNDNNLTLVNKHFKAFAKAYKDNPNLELADFIRDIGKVDFFNKLGIKEDEYYTKEIFNVLWNWKNYFNMEEMKLIAYYLSRGVYEFYDDDRYNSVNSGLFTNFFKWATFIDYTPKKEDFFRQYLMVKKTYKTNKKGFDNKSIQFQLNKHSHIWEFNNDEFCIVVPTCVDDFKDEAQQQNNCVYNMYMERVIHGNTNVIFIRKKNEMDKSYITCEVDNDGYIRQYLLRHNTRVKMDTSENAFRVEFEKFIAENWNERK